MRLNIKGFAVVTVLLLLSVFVVTGAGGYYIYHYQTNKKSADKSSVPLYAPKSFSDCLKNGGVMKYISIPEGSGVKEPNVDYSLSESRCETEKNVYYPKVDDVRCGNQQVCSDILQAAQSVCAGLIGNKSFKPTFQYNPVTKGNYSRLYLTDCNNAQNKQNRIATILLTNISGQWQVTQNLSKINCVELDKAQVPLELLPDCWNPVFYQKK